MLTKLGGGGFKEEATAGTAETITTSEMGLVRDFTIALEPNMQEREVIRNVIDSLAPIKGGTSCAVAMSLELRNGGTAGTVYNPQGDIIESLGFDESVEAGYKVVYKGRTDPSGGKSITAKGFKGGGSGKYVTVEGVRGNATLTFKSGQVGLLAYDGKGPLKARGDTATLATAKGEDPPILISADMWLLEHHAVLYEDLDGAVEVLKDGAASNQKFSIGFTQGATAQKVKKIRLNLTKNGTPANETNGLTLTVETDAAGNPSGTPITNGTATTIPTAGISTTATWVEFTFPTPPTLAATTDYHIVITGDYDDDAANSISLDTDDCTAGNQVCKYFDAAWAVLALKNISCQMLVATDPTIYFDGVEIALNNEVTLQEDPGGAEGWIYGEITDRNIRLSLAPLEKTDALTDFWGYLTAATDLFLGFQLGSTAGNIVEVKIQHCKVVNAGTWDDRGGQVTHPIELHLEDGSDMEIRLR